MFFHCCEKRKERYEALCNFFDDVLYLFDEACKTFDELVNEQKDLCPGCRFWMKSRHRIVKEGKK